MDPGFSCTTRIFPPTWRCFLCNRGFYGKDEGSCRSCNVEFVAETHRAWDRLAVERPFWRMLRESTR